MKVASFVVDLFEQVLDVVMHCSHFIESFSCSMQGEFVVVIVVYGAWFKTNESSAEGKFVGTGVYRIVSKFFGMQPSSPAVLPIVTVDAWVLLECLDCPFTESIYLWIVGGEHM